MGMVVVKDRPEIKPIAKNLIVCKGCGAHYDPKVRWVRGWRDPDSTSGLDFHAESRVKPSHCPVCDTKPEGDI